MSSTPAAAATATTKTKTASAAPRGRRISRDDRKITAALAIREVAMNLNSFDAALDKAIEMLLLSSSTTAPPPPYASNDHASSKSSAAVTMTTSPQQQQQQQQQREEAAKLLSGLKTFLSDSSKKLLVNVKIMDPIASLNYVHKRQKLAQQVQVQVQQQQQQKQQPPPNPPEEQQENTTITQTTTTTATAPIINTVDTHPRTITAATAAMATTLAPNNNNNNNNPKHNNTMIVLGPPKSGCFYYSKRQVVEILLKTPPKGSNLRTDTINKIIELKRVPSNVKAEELLHLVQKFENSNGSLEKLDNWKQQEIDEQQQKKKKEEEEQETLKLLAAAAEARRQTAREEEAAAKKQRRLNKPNLDHIVLPPLLPNEKYYSKRQVVEILSKTTKGTKLRADTTTKIVDMELVPCDRRNISRLIFNYEVAGWSLDKLCSRPWGLRGRSPLDNNYDYLNNNNAAGDDDDDEEEDGKRKRRRPPPVSVVVSPAYKKQKYTTKRKQQKPKPNLDHIILPPLTQQQQYYSRRELVEIVLQTPKGSKDRTDTISKIMELKRVPCDRRNVQRIIFNYEEQKMSNMDNKLDRPWGLRGRIALLDDDEIVSIARDVQTKPGLNVEMAILDHIKKNLQAQGIDTTSTNKEDWMPNSTTLRNYKALIGSQPNVNVKRTGLAIRK